MGFGAGIGVGIGAMERVMEMESDGVDVEAGRSSRDDAGGSCPMWLKFWRRQATALKRLADRGSLC